MIGLTRAEAVWAQVQRLAALAPGALLCGVIALAASFVAALHQGPQMLYALLFGSAFHYLSTEPRTAAGVQFCAGGLLRLGIGLLGARITVEQALALGGWTAGVIVVAVASTLACGVWVGRWLRLDWQQGVLAGGATAICGASAGLAIAAVLPRSKELDRTTLAVVISVTTLSTVAMLVYPLIARAMALPPVPAGLFIGATIHDVAQVVVAGYALGPLAGDTATIVKLCRVALLAAVVFGVSCVARRQGEPAEGAAGNSPPLLPWFLVLFFAIVALNSTGVVSPAWRDALGEVSRTCLLLGVAALGMKSSFMQLARAGWRPLLLVLLCTLWLASFVLAAAVWMAHGRL